MGSCHSCTEGSMTNSRLKDAEFQPCCIQHTPLEQLVKGACTVFHAIMCVCRWHGYGIGTKLGHALQEHAKQHGLSEIYLVVTGVQDDARALYSKLNWVEVEGKTGFEGSCVSLHKYVYRPSEKE